MRKISVCGSGYIDRVGEKRAFSLVKSAGFDAIDFPFYVYPKSKTLRYEGANYPTFFHELAKMAENEGLEIGQTHAPFGYRDEDADSEEMITNYKKCIEGTAILGAKYLVIHPVKYRECMYDHLRKECFDMNIRVFRKLEPTLKEYGVTAILENMFIADKSSGSTKLVPTIYSSGAELASAVDMLGDNFGACFDSGHALITGENAYEMICTLDNRLKVVHLHDNCGVSDDHAEPFSGKVPFDEIANALKKINYKGNVNLEVHFAKVPEEKLLEALCNNAKIAKKIANMIDGGQNEKN